MSNHEILPIILAIPVTVVMLWSGITGWKITLNTPADKD